MLRPIAGCLVLALFASSGCTVVKPAVGCFTGPVVALSQPGCWCHTSCHDEGVLYAFAGLAMVGAVAGLVTGVVSDYHAVTGTVDDPTNNWWDPFATNAQAASPETPR
jgi:hypothetical protein